MKVHEIRNVIEQWAQAQKRAGCSKQADALIAFSKSLSSADKLTMTTLLKKINVIQKSQTKPKKN